MGCLSWPMRLLGGLGLIIALAMGWLYRDRLSAELRRLLHSPGKVSAESTKGRPGSLALVSARSKVDSLNGWRADSVVLTPSEVASLIGSGLDPALRQQLDSMQIQLVDGGIVIEALLSTARLPRELIGPLSIALRPKERVEAGGAVEVVGPRRAEWTVRSFRIRGFPIPGDAVPKLVAKALGDSTKRTIPIRIPAGIRKIRIESSGATLFGTPRP
jgi:hypothetical protein